RADGQGRAPARRLPRLGPGWPDRAPPRGLRDRRLVVRGARPDRRRMAHGAVDTVQVIHRTTARRHTAARRGLTTSAPGIPGIPGIPSVPGARLRDPARPSLRPPTPPLTFPRTYRERGHSEVRCNSGAAPPL